MEKNRTFNPGGKIIPIRGTSAGSIARERLLGYLDGKLEGEADDTEWEFYTFLLRKAEGHRPDRSGYGSLEYQDDRAEAARRNRARGSGEEAVPAV